MDTYLQLCRSNLGNLSQFKSVSIVIGNESCDLDSAISAIVLAYVKYHEALNKQAENDEAVIVLPVLNVPREDLHLRREIVFWFEEVVQFDLKVLICRDEIDYDQLNSSSSADIALSLVDHNENKELARLLPRGHFEEIVDHHKPTYADGACHVTDQSKVLIDTTIGSCCSLVALRFLDCNLVSKFGKQEINSDSQIALLLYGPILLDTICFNHAAKRFNVKDYEAVNKLEDLLKHTPDAESSLLDRQDVYQRLVEAKNSLDGLTFNELLRKDMKIVESITDNNLAICIPAITGTKLTELALKEKLGELKAFSQNPPSSAVFSESRPRLFNAVVLLSMDNRIPNNLQRQLALYCENKLLMRTIATCLERNSELELELITPSETLRIYNQNNLTATRKMVLPIISTILNGPGQQRSNDAAHALLAPNSKPLQSVHSVKKHTTFSIDTAEVDPEYLESFKSKTISVPEFEEFIRQHNASNFKLFHPTAIHESAAVCPNSPENAKRSDSVGSDSLISHPSAPSSLIQQPDSYYGSYIEDSFVGDFVGDYMDPDNDHIQENILVMDADGQNLVMMNPNDAISHSHEIEFDFDSFGPESIIYAGNVDAIVEKNTATTENDTNENGNEDQQQVVAAKETSNGDDSALHNSTDNVLDGAKLVEKSLPENVLLGVKLVTAESETKKEEHEIKPEQNETNLDHLAELISSGASHTVEMVQSNGELVNGKEETVGQIEIELNPNPDHETANKETLVVEDNESAPQSNLTLPASALSSFSRNNTLTRSQRKKVSPQVNIKNLIMASNTYSPPVLDSSLIPPLQPTNPSAVSSQVNGERTDQNENFIISSLAQKQNETLAHSEGNELTLGSIDHPLSISTSASHNSLSEFGLNSNGLGGLTRQPSMKKKVPVNYDMLLHNNFDKEDEGEKPPNSNSLGHINEVNDLNNRESGLANVVENANHTTPQPQSDEDHHQPGLGESFLIGNGEQRPIDLKVIEPYRKVISHGGYMHASADGRNVEGSSPAIIIFSACYLPDRARKDYHYVMDNLFMYVLTTLHNMIADDYILIYLHNGGLQNSGPTFGWLKRCYQMIDRKLKKNLKGLYILHPTFWLKTIIIMSRPFISSKFSRKLKFVRSLEELYQMIPIEHIAIPEPVKM